MSYCIVYFYWCDVYNNGTKSGKASVQCLIVLSIFIDTMYTTMGLNLAKLVYNVLLYCLFYWYDVYNNGIKSGKASVQCLIVLSIFIDTMYATSGLNLTTLVYNVLFYCLF